MANIGRDKETIRQMIAFYVRHHQMTDEQRAEYEALADYACRRLDHCRYGERKPACKNCSVHCYAPARRKMMQQVMRWSGPRMMFYAPRATFRHFWQSLTKKAQ